MKSFDFGSSLSKQDKIIISLPINKTRRIAVEKIRDEKNDFELRSSSNNPTFLDQLCLPLHFALLYN